MDRADQGERVCVHIFLSLFISIFETYCKMSKKIINHSVYSKKFYLKGADCTVIFN